jgi:hypothetical protein
MPGPSALLFSRCSSFAAHCSAGRKRPPMPRWRRPRKPPMAALVPAANNSGKALHDCVANVLDKLSNDINVARADISSTRSALQTAASRLRAAANKTQALSAITQCRALISGALAKVRAIGGGYVAGWSGGSGGGIALKAIAGVLGHAAKLIQAKGRPRGEPPCSGSCSIHPARAAPATEPDRQPCPASPRCRCA